MGFFERPNVDENLPDSRWTSLGRGALSAFGGSPSELVELRRSLSASSRSVTMLLRRLNLVANLLMSNDIRDLRLDADVESFMLAGRYARHVHEET
jgi:hypothetical protein